MIDEKSHSVIGWLFFLVCSPVFQIWIFTGFKMTNLVVYWVFANVNDHLNYLILTTYTLISLIQLCPHNGLLTG